MMTAEIDLLKKSFLLFVYLHTVHCQYGGGRGRQIAQEVIQTASHNYDYDRLNDADYQEYFNDNHGFNPSDFPDCQCEYKFNELGQGNCNSGSISGVFISFSTMSKFCTHRAPDRSPHKMGACNTI